MIVNNEIYEKELAKQLKKDGYKRAEMENYEIIPNVSKKNFLKTCETLCPGFVIDSHNKDVITNLYSYFHGINGEYDTFKGILIQGNTGTGKTVLMYAYELYLRIEGMLENHFEIIRPEILQLEYQKDGFEVFNNYSFNKSKNQYGVLQPHPNHLLIDELNYDVYANYYGEKINIVESLLTQRYEVFKQYGKFTHATTNLNTKELKEHFSNRILSRMREMFNIVTLTGEDRR